MSVDAPSPHHRPIVFYDQRGTGKSQNVNLDSAGEWTAQGLPTLEVVRADSLP